jgi:hypothetical protein
MVGIDAEFVTLNQEEAEVKSDGTHTTLKPIQFSVARITVIRGSVGVGVGGWEGGRGVQSDGTHTTLKPIKVRSL